MSVFIRLRLEAVAVASFLFCALFHGAVVRSIHVRRPEQWILANPRQLGAVHSAHVHSAARPR